MAIPLQHSEAQRAVARKAYETLEPFHVVAYFNPHLKDVTKEAGLSWRAGYVGARGGPLGTTPAAVVTSCFYNFSPVVIESGWDGAVAHGLSKVMGLREKAVDRTLREALGGAAESADLAQLATELQDIALSQQFLGRPLAAAWSTQPVPSSPHLAFWHAVSILREWRGDGHLTALVQAGLDPVETNVFHEAQHPDPSVRKRAMGRAAAMKTRGWGEDEWNAAVDRLATRGLITPGGGEEFLTDEGGRLYDLLEEQTDDVAVWRGVDDPSPLLQRARPFVKAVIDAGVLPGTGSQKASTSVD